MAYQKELPLFDIYQTSYLALKGVPIRYEKRGSRVVFLVPNNDDTIRLLNQFQNNPTGGLLDFTAALRRVRAQMLEARDGNGDGDIHGRKTY
jgi:hypothetical protein